MQTTAHKQLRAGHWIARVFAGPLGSDDAWVTFSLSHAQRDDGIAGVAAGYVAGDLWDMVELVGLLATTFCEDSSLAVPLRKQIERLAEELASLEWDGETTSAE